MLFVVLLGGKHPRAKIEVHDVVFAVADTLEQSYPQLRREWFGSPAGLHIDSWLEVDGVDGYRLEMSDVQPAAGEQRLFFVNLGGYEPHTFGEAHRYLLVVAADKAEAKRKGKARMAPDWDKPHTDALLEVDDCLPIDVLGGRYVRLVAGEHRGVIQRSDYLLL